MIVVMQPGAGEAAIQAVIAGLIDLGFDVHRETGTERTVLACLGVRTGFDASGIAALAGVDAVHRISAPYKLAARACRPQGTIVRVRNLAIGDGQKQVQIPAGAVVEIAAESEVAEIARSADLLRVSGPSMANAPLLRAVGAQARPVLLERSPAASLEEFLLAAEIVLVAGNPGVILCERGNRSLAQPDRVCPDLAAVARLKLLTHLPVCCDLSAQGDLAPVLARAALAAGANAVLLASE
ncbi:MAG TPA: hypothetical protein VN690_02800 [Terriglobales bacterium]|nr:hypothetical protein [Terriglobales bacterium]